MESLQIEALKSIKNSGLMQLKPITIFVGRNSSGKSSIVRSLPLLKQSSASKTLGTVLWSGKYVDYGSFDESVNADALSVNPDSEIIFSLVFKIGQSITRGQLLPRGTEVGLDVRVFGNEYSKNSYTRFEYRIFENTISLQYNSAFDLMAAFLNGVDFHKAIAEHYFPVKGYSIIPSFFNRIRVGKDSITAALSKELGRHVHHRTSQDTLDRAAKALRFAPDEIIKKTLSLRSLVGEVAAAKISKWSTTREDFVRIKNQVLFCALEEVTDQVKDTLQDYFESLRYITPLRAAADRYYRIQNTSIEELDPNGSNLAMFLHAKKEDEIEKINDWLKSEIGFSIEMGKTHGHASIFIVDEDGRKTNIADTGFGFSQILPILIQMWQSSKGSVRRYRRMTTPEMVVIEQPELHLHPKMQSQVGRMFCKAIAQARSGHVDLRVIIETHSKDIVEAIGRSVEDKTISQDDVAIYVVDKYASKCVSASSFDKGGFLVDWPYGFFDGDD